MKIETRSRAAVAFLAMAAPTLLGAPSAFASGGGTKHPQVVLPPDIHLAASGRYLQDICRSDQPLRCLAMRLLPESWAPGEPVPMGTPGPFAAVAMAPADVLAAYAIPASTKAGGKIVAIFGSPDSAALSDLNAYRTHFGIPTMPKCTGAPTGTTTCFAQFAEDGSASKGGDSGQADGATAVGLDMVSAACPDCSILLIELTQIAQTDIRAVVHTASTMGAAAISLGFGAPESTDPTCTGGAAAGCGVKDPIGYTTPGHLVLAAAGGSGYLNVDQSASSPLYPSSAPDVVSVGGTDLFNKAGVYDEAVWNDGVFSSGPTGTDVTASGCSTEFDMPTWQATALTGSGCAKRATADLSAPATYHVGASETGIAIYAASAGGLTAINGTSASSALMAAILTRLNLTDQISADLGWEYEHASAFNDLGSAAYPVDPSGRKTDANITTCGILCNAGAGWDGPSGVGTPNGAKLAALSTGGATDGGAEGGTDGGGDGDSGDAGGPIAPGGDGGAGIPPEGGVGADAGSTSKTGSPSAGGCTCTTSVGSSCTPGDTGLMLLALGAMVRIGRRARKRA